MIKKCSKNNILIFLGVLIIIATLDSSCASKKYPRHKPVPCPCEKQKH